jgi:hypothetical protein
MRRVGVDPDDGLYADHVTAQMRSCAGAASDDPAALRESTGPVPVFSIL